MDEGMPLRLYTLGEKFDIAQTVDVHTTAEAMTAVISHLKDSGFTNLRTVVDDDGFCLRFVADPPKGRRGRNVASLDL